MGDRVAVTMEMAELGVETLERWRFLLSSVAQPYSHWTAATNSIQGSLVLQLRHAGDRGGSQAEEWNLELGSRVGSLCGCSVHHVADLGEASDSPPRAAAFTRLVLRKGRASLLFPTAVGAAQRPLCPSWVTDNQLLEFRFTK